MEILIYIVTQQIEEETVEAENSAMHT